MAIDRDRKLDVVFDCGYSIGMSTVEQACEQAKVLYSDKLEERNLLQFFYTSNQNLVSSEKN